MAAFAVENWMDLDGLAASLGMKDLRKLTLDRFCNFIWWVMVRNLETEVEVSALRAKLWRPPPRVKVEVTEGPWSADAEMVAFASLRAALGQ